LLGRIAITDLSIRRPAFGVRIGRLDLDWSPLQALGGILPIHALLVRDLDVVLGKADAGADDPLVLPDLSIPLRIDVGNALV
jgi:translocation and assembly module TamB